MSSTNKEVHFSLICKANKHESCSHYLCDCECHAEMVLLGSGVLKDKRGALWVAGSQLWYCSNLPVGEKRTDLFTAVLKATGFDFTEDEVNAFSAAFSVVEKGAWSLGDFLEAYDSEIGNGSAYLSLF